MVLQSEPFQMQRVNFLDFHLSVSLWEHRGYGIIYSTRSEVPFVQSCCVLVADTGLAALSVGII
jgi:hypothetical protein